MHNARLFPAMRVWKLCRHNDCQHKDLLGFHISNVNRDVSAQGLGKRAYVVGMASANWLLLLRWASGHTELKGLWMGM